MAYKKILIALEGLETEHKVLEEAKIIKEACEAELAVIHVNDPAAGKPHAMMGSLPLVTEEQLLGMVEKAGLDRNLKIIMVESEQYAKEIAKAAKEFDLLLVGHKSKNSIKAFFVDSVDERISDMVDCPILVVTRK